MLILGIVLILLALLLPGAPSILLTLGIILAVIGAILWVLPAERIGGRRYY